MMMCFYFKRNRYLKVKSVGRNNLGRITVRGKQKFYREKKSYFYEGFNYLYLRNMTKFFYFFNILKCKVKSKMMNRIDGLFKYVVIILNSFLKGCYLFLPASEKVLLNTNLIIGDHDFLYNGNILFLRNVPIGSLIHNIFDKNGIYIKRSKRNSYIVYQGFYYVTVKLPSGKLKLINKNVFCIFGGLEFHKVLKHRKAGESRKLGKRPKVRGVAMNACDHPHGGGEGKSSIGRKSIFSIWGKKCKGVHTKTRFK